MRGWELGAFVQVRNALGHRNDVTVSSSILECVSRMPGTGNCAEEEFRDYFQRGLPILPVIGLRARF
jgi:hypothetical protein